MSDVKKQQTNAEIYAGLSADTMELVQGLTADEIAMRVPQSPDWSIREVIAHVVGIIDDILSDNLGAIGTDAWTEAQVASRSDRTLDEVCAEWVALAPAFTALGTANPVMAMRATADLVTHHHDIRQALDRSGHQDSPAIRLGLERYGPFFCERVAAAGLPIVRVEIKPDDHPPIWQSADGEPAAVVRGSAFELLRAFSGRRSAGQVLAMDWTGDPEPYLAVVTPYGLPTDDVIE